MPNLEPMDQNRRHDESGKLSRAAQTAFPAKPKGGARTTRDQPTIAPPSSLATTISSSQLSELPSLPYTMFQPQPFYTGAPMPSSHPTNSAMLTALAGPFTFQDAGKPRKSKKHDKRGPETQQDQAPYRVRQVSDLQALVSATPDIPASISEELSQHLQFLPKSQPHEVHAIQEQVLDELAAVVQEETQDLMQQHSDSFAHLQHHVHQQQQQQHSPAATIAMTTTASTASYPTMLTSASIQADFQSQHPSFNQLFPILQGTATIGADSEFDHGDSSSADEGDDDTFNANGNNGSNDDDDDEDDGDGDGEDFDEDSYGGDGDDGNDGDSHVDDLVDAVDVYDSVDNNEEGGNSGNRNRKSGGHMLRQRIHSAANANYRHQQRNDASMQRARQLNQYHAALYGHEQQSTSTTRFPAAAPHASPRLPLFHDLPQEDGHQDDDDDDDDVTSVGRRKPLETSNNRRHHPRAKEVGYLAVTEHEGPNTQSFAQHPDPAFLDAKAQMEWHKQQLLYLSQQLEAARATASVAKQHARSTNSHVKATNLERSATAESMPQQNTMDDATGARPFRRQQQQLQHSASVSPPPPSRSFPNTNRGAPFVPFSSHAQTTSLALNEGLVSNSRGPSIVPAMQQAKKKTRKGATKGRKSSEAMPVAPAQSMRSAATESCSGVRGSSAQQDTPQQKVSRNATPSQRNDSANMPAKKPKKVPHKTTDPRKSNANAASTATRKGKGGATTKESSFAVNAPHAAQPLWNSPTLSGAMPSLNESYSPRADMPFSMLPFPDTSRQDAVSDLTPSSPSALPAYTHYAGSPFVSQQGFMPFPRAATATNSSTADLQAQYAALEELAKQEEAQLDRDLEQRRKKQTEAKKRRRQEAKRAKLKANGKGAKSSGSSDVIAAASDTNDRKHPQQPSTAPSTASSRKKGASSASNQKKAPEVTQSTARGSLGAATELLQQAQNMRFDRHLDDDDNSDDDYDDDGNVDMDGTPTSLYALSPAMRPDSHTSASYADSYDDVPIPMPPTGPHTLPGMHTQASMSSPPLTPLTPSSTVPLSVSLPRLDKHQHGSTVQSTVKPAKPRRRRKRKYPSRGQPQREAYDSDDKYEAAMTRWKDIRLRNNASVRKSRHRLREYVREKRKALRVIEKEGEQLRAVYTTLRANCELLLRKFYQPGTLSNVETAWVQTLVNTPADVDLMSQATLSS